MEPAGRKRDVRILEIKDLGLHENNLKKWSTDRNDVWELWDELPFKEKASLINMWVMSSFELDFADIVSQAWITWKSEQQ